MSDQSGAPQGGTSANEGAPQGGTSDFDYVRAYEQLRPEYTRTTQRLSEFETLFAGLQNPDPAIQAQAAEALGLEFAEETGAPAAPVDDEDFDDPLEGEVKELREIVSELRERSELEATARQQAETEELRDEFIGESLDSIESDLKTQDRTFKGFSEQEEEVLGNLAIAMADDDDVPDVAGAYQRLYGENGIIETRFQQRIDNRLNANQAPLGTAIPAEKKPQNAAERVQYMDRRVRDLEDQQ